MKKSLILIFLLLGLGAKAQNIVLEENFIEVRESLQRTVFPDQIWFSFWFPDGEGSTVEKRLAKLEGYMKEHQIPRGNLVEREKLQTQQPFPYTYQEDAYQFFIQLPGLALAADLEEFLEEIGAKQFKFAFAEHSEWEAIRGQLYRGAMEQAMEAARAILEPSGQKPGKVVFVRELESPRLGRGMDFESSRKKVMGVTQRVVRLSPMLLQVNLVIRFEIQ